MFDNMQIVEVLKLGFIGLGFLLALLSFWLLRSEQNKNQPNPNMITPIYVFMGFSLIMAGAAMFLQFNNSASEKAAILTPYKLALVSLAGLIESKEIISLRDNPDTAQSDVAKKLSEEIEEYRQKGMLD